MDDFYNEMKEVFDSLPNKAAKDIMISHDSLSTRDSSFFPSAEALESISTLRVNHYADQFLSLQGLSLTFRINSRRIYQRRSE